MSRLLRAYDALLNKRPILTKAVTSAGLFPTTVHDNLVAGIKMQGAVLFAAGDIMSQKLEGAPAIDFARLGRMSLWGGIFAPLAHYWYMYLDVWFPGKGVAVIAKKVAADQFTWTIFINATFFFYSNITATGSAAKAIEAIQEKMWPTLKVNWTVWPVLTGFNLAVVPLQYRILFINFCSLFWSAFLSNMANKGEPAIEAPPSELK